MTPKGRENDRKSGWFLKSRFMIMCLLIISSGIFTSCSGHKVAGDNISAGNNVEPNHVLLTLGPVTGA